MSDFAAKVKRFYDLGLWDDIRVKNAVLKGALTEEEFKSVTGKEFSA